MPKRRRPGQLAHRIPSPGRSIKGGILYVDPYLYVFETFSKKRWFGRPLLDVLNSEFGRGQSREYFERCMEEELVTVGNARARGDQVVGEHDLLQHWMHRHEPPVSAQRIDVLEEKDGLYSLNKTAPMPMHPSGGYHHNTLKNILESTLGRPVYLAHRLDRLTTGLVVFALDSRRAEELSSSIRSRECQKTYLARVAGDFPKAMPEDIKVPEGADAASLPPVRIEAPGEGGWFRVVAPLRCRDPAQGIWEVARDGQADAKAAETRMRRLNYDGSTTLLEVKPITGRTHQIRLHCQLAGHPIANDPGYGGSTAVKLVDGRPVAAPPASSSAQVVSLGPLEAQKAPPPPLSDPLPQETVDRMLAKAVAVCPTCTGKERYGPEAGEEGEEGGAPYGYDHRGERSSGIWLHAWKYAGSNWSFEAPLPPWARLDAAD